MKRIVAAILVFVCLVSYSAIVIDSKSIEAENKEVRACWVSSVGNLDFPSKQGLSTTALMAEINSIVKNCSLMGINTIYFQVRPTGDALYASRVFPWSAYLTGKQGVAPADGFDPLKYFVKQAKSAGVELHAWINPYRIETGENVTARLCDTNPAVVHPEYTVACHSGLYYNPGIPEARTLILRGIEELVQNYEIDGIHFDDYFYPYDMSGFDDSQAYKKYGAGLSLEDFRRDSVNQLVSSVHKRIKELNPAVEFGISPFGIWANRSVHPEGSDTRGMNAYSEIFADSKKWVEEGWVDYICPQIYWNDQNKAAPFRVLVDWWSELCKKNNVKLYVGIGAYKVGTDEAGWESGSVLYDQLEYSLGKSDGHCFFRYGVLVGNKNGLLDAVQKYYGKHASLPSVKEEIEITPITPVPVSELKITSPANGQTVSGGYVSVSGVTSPGKNVRVNGVEATISDRGFFSAYIPLKLGTNQLTVSDGTQTKSIRVIRKSASPLSSADMSSASPSGSVIHNPGDCVEFSIRAPSGEKVVLKNDIIRIPLIASDESSETYIGYWTVSSLPVGNDLVLDKFSYEFERDGNIKTVESDLVIRIVAQGYDEKGILVSEAHTFDQSTGGSQMDHDPLREGAAIRVVAAENDRYLLDSGYWVSQETVGSTRILRRDVANYLYDVLTISSVSEFSYSSDWNDGNITICFSKGGRHDFEVMSDCDDLSYTFFQGISSSKMVLSYKEDEIAGYEIVPQKNRITVYVRRHTGALEGKRILIDAGHGGSDPGAYGPGGEGFADEADLNLLLADRLKKKLEEQGVTVVLTRSDDNTVTLVERAELTEKSSPEVMISLHFNSVDAESNYAEATGGLILYSVPLSLSLAENIAAEFGKEIYSGSVPVRRQSLKVCRQTECPTVLVEGGFLCNPKEYELLLNEDTQEKMAQNIVDGLIRYFTNSTM